MLRAVTLDYWGTLYQGDFVRPYRLALLGELLAQTGQRRTPDELQAAYAHCWDVFDLLWKQQHRSMTIAHWLSEFLSFLQVELPPDLQAGLYPPLQEALLERPPHLVPGVAEVIPRLAARYRLGVISDVGLTPGRVLRELLRRDGLADCFRAMTFSDEVGATKPLPEVFLHTLATLEVRPEEAAHVGDLPETDLAGARGVGMKAVLFLGMSHREDGREMADGVFSSYGELEEVLARL
jgi:putative hydrolase of the HAD superfamily